MSPGGSFSLRPPRPASVLTTIAGAHPAGQVSMSRHTQLPKGCVPHQGFMLVRIFLIYLFKGNGFAFIYLTSAYVRMHMGMWSGHGTCVKVRSQFVEVILSFYLVLGVKLESSGSVASAFTHLAMPAA